MLCPPVLLRKVGRKQVRASVSAEGRVMGTEGAWQGAREELRVWVAFCVWWLHIYSSSCFAVYCRVFNTEHLKHTSTLTTRTATATYRRTSVSLPYFGDATTSKNYNRRTNERGVVL